MVPTLFGSVGYRCGGRSKPAVNSELNGDDHPRDGHTQRVGDNIEPFKASIRGESLQALNERAHQDEYHGEFQSCDRARGPLPPTVHGNEVGKGVMPFVGAWHGRQQITWEKRQHPDANKHGDTGEAEEEVRGHPDIVCAKGIPRHTRCIDLRRWPFGAGLQRKTA